MLMMVILILNLLCGFIDMNNLIRKELRRIQEMLSQLEKQCTFQAEKIMIQDARISLVRADYYDFHVNPKKKYVEPKSDFKYE